MGRPENRSDAAAAEIASQLTGATVKRTMVTITFNERDSAMLASLRAAQGRSRPYDIDRDADVDNRRWKNEFASRGDETGPTDTEVPAA